MAMTNDERDNIIRQTAADVQEIKSLHGELLGRHDRSLYGNGRPGIVQLVESIAQAQRDCPARKSADEGRTLRARQTWLQILLSLLMGLMTAWALTR